MTFHSMIMYSYLFFLSFVLCFFHIFFFFNDPATPEFYTLSLHAALPILMTGAYKQTWTTSFADIDNDGDLDIVETGSEEHTSELQSPDHLVCRLLLEKKKKNQ